MDQLDRLSVDVQMVLEAERRDGGARARERDLEHVGLAPDQVFAEVSELGGSGHDRAGLQLGGLRRRLGPATE